MSALPLQFDEITRHSPDAIVTFISQHHQVTRLLAHAMSLIERDQDEAMEFVRRASALSSDPGRRSEKPGLVTRGGLAPWQAERVKRHIEQNHATRINLEDLTQITRLSSSYFSTAFRVTFGTSPHDYVCRRRVEHARHLMVTTDNPLSEIALDCGFSDQSHLTRVFRRVTAQTPAAWRRRARVA